ncbi:mRNA-decapping enzyme subunit 2-like isoform X2 [Cucumis melo]|uniref:mRNA-decapping enzyme subunit 2-like isoform X2 n=1 Tax=Cucumis melo TaxID=3656 RepID=A0ABM3LA89_CUCME|nr:mRNA-decapping enzyme subunit 2-like isoform X2 [Cucumis melo]
MASLHLPSNAPVKNGLPPQELLDDLCSRFVLNVPKEDLQSFERILFLVEYAHWFYEDNSVENNPSLKSFNLKEFTSLLFSSCDVLKPYVPHIDDIFKDFTSYKLRVPVTGGIILDETFERCLLVKGWKGSSWSFPRGKKSKDEEDHACAIREEIAWHRLDDLLPVSDDVISHGITGLKLYMVAPFLESLRSWILKHQPPVAPNFDMPVKGYTMWKVKNTSMSNSSIIFDNQPIKLDSDPGRSLKNFKFDTASILQAMESAFAA